MINLKAVAVVGVGAVMPEADTALKFWDNIKSKRYSIKDVPGERWNASLYYAADPSIEDKTYSKIGSWVQDFNFDPIKWGILIPSGVQNNMDDSQKWAIAASRQALLDYGYPDRPLESERVAVIFGNSLAGEKHYRTNLRIHIPQFTSALANLPDFQSLAPEVRETLLEGLEKSVKASTPEINEDTMPGELANILAGRVANVFNFAGANFVTDAACASSLAAFQAAVDGLATHKYDAVLTGGVDRNNGAASFVKFSKIGALSPDGSRPYAEGANGFVMGEGAAVFLLKRLEDAERDQDKIYAVIRGIGSSSDGKGKGITAPNPIGQQRAIQRAWQDAGVSLASAGLIEGHGTSTKVGDVVEVNSLAAVFGEAGLPANSIGLGSVKSNIGHLKSASGAAGLLKVIFALKDQVLPPSANFQAPNPDINFSQTPFYVVNETQPWEKPAGEVRRAGISSFGFGGTNFHMVVEEHVPGMLTSDSKSVAVPAMKTVETTAEPVMSPAAVEAESPLYSGMAFVAGESVKALREQLNGIKAGLENGKLPPNTLPSTEELSQQHRMAVSYADTQQLSDRIERAEKALDSLPETVWQAYNAHGIYYGEGAPGKIAFLFPGQGSQYVNMMRDIHDREPVVAETFRDADEVMTPHLGQPLSAYIFEDREDEASQKAAAEKLKDTTITQPAILTANIAMLRLMAQFKIKPDMLIGHSLGEYAALVTAGAITFREGLETVSARGQAMSAIDVEDNGAMAAVSAPIAKVEEILAQIDGYAVLANVNSPVQSVIGGDTETIDKAVSAFEAEGIRAVKIPVSHAFHTRIVAPASVVLRKMLDTVNVQPPKMPIAANVTGKLYPSDPTEIRDMLGDHIASPVQFVSGVQTLFDQGCRVFIESGPKRVLSSLSRDILKGKEGITVVSTNHPRKGGIASFHEALCGLYAAGVGGVFETAQPEVSVPAVETQSPELKQTALQQSTDSLYPPLTGSVVVSGAGLGLPGREHAVFEDDNIQSILKGNSRIESLPEEVRQQMVDRRPTRLEKRENGAEWVPIDSIDQTSKLAGQRGSFDLADEFGMKPERAEVLDISTKLAIAAGIEALRDAGIPLVMGYKQTSTGSYLPQRWMLPKSMADETGVIFGSAFPGLDELSKEADSYHRHQSLKEQIRLLEEVLAETPTEQQPRLEERVRVLQAELAALNYGFDRKFIFRVLNMGHSQFAEFIGARGPNSAVNAACATTTHAIALAEDWIRAGRCRRVVVVAGDDVTGGDLVNWIGTGLLATGAATTEGDLRKAALPFDLRRNGMIMGMGAAALVVESQDAVEERGMRGIAEVLATDIANSAFHGTRLDVGHVSEVMDRLMTKAEAQFGLDRHAIAERTMFMSHETYTPARGGSAAAEIRALRQTFGEHADQVMITNTKGYTGHTMGVGVEDVVAVKGLEHSLVPPIANLDADFQPDPDLGNLNLTRESGTKNVDYALRLGAGFGSQIAMALFRRIPGVGERIEDRPGYQAWLAGIAGYQTAETETVQRTLRIANQGKPEKAPRASSWRYGRPPIGWAARPEDQSVEKETQPASVVGESAAPVQEVTGKVVSVDVEEVKTFVLGLVSEKTGYPTEILDPGLDLEADLGIDTVKQAELFAAVRENYSIPRQEDLRLVDYNTLEKVVGFVMDMAGQTETTAEPVAVAEPVSEPDPVPMIEITVPVQTVDVEEVKTFVLGLVSEKTGYPTEILDPGLDLEADLGIDTVKQAELFAAVRENYSIPRQEDLRLVDYNTLEKVVGFVMDMAGQTETAAEPVAVAEPVSEPDPAPMIEITVPVQTVDVEEVKTFVLGLVSEKTGYPTEILDPGLDLEADLGIDTVKQAELFAAVRENYSIPRQEDLRLVDYNTLEKVVGFVMDMAGQTETAAVPVTVAEPVSEPDPALVIETAAPVQEAIGKVVSVDVEEVKTFVLGLVSEKTGYPTEILDPGLDLEADLGIDTVKQAELFAAVRENYSIPRQEDLRLVDYNTLEKVVGFVMDMAGQTEPAAEQETETNELPAMPEELSDSGGVPRRVPVPMLRPRLDLCLPTGVELDDVSRVLVVDDGQGVGAPLAEKLAQKGVEIRRMAATPGLAEKAVRWVEDGLVSGVYYLAGMDPEPGIETISIEEWQGLLESRLEPLFELMKALPEDVFLLTALQSGGLHGYGPGGALSSGAGIAGFTKALAMERAQSMIKLLDFEPGMDPAGMADILIAETLHDPDAVEIGYHLGQRFTIALNDQPWSETMQFEIGEEPVFLVSGGTGGITLPIVEDLARQTRGRFYLIGRTPLPEADDPDLALLRQSREDLQSKWMQASLTGDEKLTPVQIRGKLDAFERLAATRQAIDAIRANGGKVEYLKGDVTNPASMEEVVRQVVGDAGRIDVLIHAAGYERSRKLRRKPLEEFRKIVDVKATGFVNIYKAMQQTDVMPRAMVLFSSIAGRYGNTGQVDYSAANDLLARFASMAQTKHPKMRITTLDWGAWAEVGMASRGNIPWLMAQAGIEMIDPAEGAPLVYRELVYGQGHEALFAGSLGALEESASKAGGLDLEAANAALREGDPPHIMLSSVSGYSPTVGMTLEVTLNPEDEPFLHDHSLNGTPLLPGVMGIEGFAVAAQHIASVMGQAGDSYRVSGLEDIRFLTPFKFYRNEPRHILWNALPLWRENHLSVAVTLESTSPSRLETENKELVRHFSGVVGLQPTYQQAPASTAAPPDWNGHYTLSNEQIYQLYFHGPAFQVLEGVQRSGAQLLGKLKPNLPEFTSRPITLDTTPVLLELCLQTAGIWEIGLTGALSLPHSIGRVRLYRREVNGIPVFAEVSKREDAEGLVFNSRVVDAKGQVYLEMENYRTVVTPYPVEVSQREPLERLVNGD